MFAPLPLALVLIGPFVGSYVAATADRLIAGVPLLTARSRCDACGRVLRPWDMVPLASWLVLRGRCRDCSARIGAHLWLAEVAAGAIGLASAVAAPGWLAPVSALFGWALLLLALLDCQAMWLPRIGGWGLAACGLGVGAVLGREPLISGLIGAATGWAVLAGLGFAWQRVRGVDGLGEGDPPLLAAAGAWVGWQGLASVVLIAACTGIVHALLARRAAPGAAPASAPVEPPRVPFGAHLALAMFAVWLAGPLG